MRKVALPLCILVLGIAALLACSQPQPVPTPTATPTPTPAPTPTPTRRPTPVTPTPTLTPYVVCEEKVPLSIAPTAADTFLELRYFDYSRICKITPRIVGHSEYSHCETAVFHTVQVRQDGSILLDGVAGVKQLTEEETAQVRAMAFEGLRFADRGSLGAAPEGGGQAFDDACKGPPLLRVWIGLDGRGRYVYSYPDTDQEALQRIERLLAVPTPFSSAGA